MKMYYDLHIHSALSPCGESEMTPNNIVNMALLKSLDVIAITDHNAIANVAATLEVARNQEIFVVPGIEVQSKDDVHTVCLFKTLQQLECFYEEIYRQIMPLRHDDKKFGKQIVLDSQDRVIDYLQQSLYASIQLSVDQVIDLAHAHGGAAMLSHLDRPSYSMIANLGFIPAELAIRAIELSSAANIEEFLAQHSYLARYQVLINSDAHELVQISEPIHALELEEKTLDCLFSTVFGV